MNCGPDMHMESHEARTCAVRDTGVWASMHSAREQIGAINGVYQHAYHAVADQVEHPTQPATDLLTGGDVA